ncbi:hypothetical protein QYF36_018219 [Acer negundo]|nr:hypothetical protein QYF36_018219 [Acer negundo]
MPVVLSEVREAWELVVCNHWYSHGNVENKKPGLMESWSGVEWSGGVDLATQLYLLLLCLGPGSASRGHTLFDENFIIVYLSMQVLDCVEVTNTKETKNK